MINYRLVPNLTFLSLLFLLTQVVYMSLMWLQSKYFILFKAKNLRATCKFIDIHLAGSLLHKLFKTDDIPEH